MASERAGGSRRALLAAAALTLLAIVGSLLFDTSAPEGSVDGALEDARSHSTDRVWNPASSGDRGEEDMRATSPRHAPHVGQPERAGQPPAPSTVKGPTPGTTIEGGRDGGQGGSSSGSPNFRPGEEDAEVSASLGREEIQEVIADMKPRVKACYDELIEAFPEADGVVKLSFTIVASQGTSHIDLEEVAPDSTLFDARLHQCLIDALREQAFPLPDVEDGSVRVNYPFRFTNEEAEAHN